MIRTICSGVAALVVAGGLMLPAARAADAIEGRASQIIGKTVTNGMDQKIGTVDDLLISGNGHTVRAVLSVGGFLGIGDRLVVVPYGDIKKRADALVLDRSAEQLKALPAFKYELAAATAGPRDSYMRSADRRMADWNKRMVDWKRTAKNASSEAGQKLDQAWATTKEKFAGLKHATADGWERAKGDFDKAWGNLESAWKDATS